jgi:hemoglobin-like flavoprotein
MTPKQIELVQQSWKNVEPIQSEAASLFYTRLFETDPALRPLFKGDIKEQGRKLMAMITLVVNGLTRLDTLVPRIRDLGKKHRDYGVRAEHYSTVAGALLWTLEKGLGSSFTAEVKEAWTTAYGVLASTMQKGAAADAA